MFKLTPEINLKPVFLTGAIATATLLSPLAVKSASAIQLVPNTDCSITNLTTSSKCSGIYQGNDSNQDVTGLFSPPNYGWVEVAKAQGPENGNPWTDNGLTVTFDDIGLTSGKWSYTNPTRPLMFVLKGGDTFTAYLITSKEATSGNWNTNDLLKGNGQPGPGLSHFAVYEDAPEPLTLLGAAAATAFGVAFKKQLGKKRRDQDQA